MYPLRGVAVCPPKRCGCLPLRDVAMCPLGFWLCAHPRGVAVCTPRGVVGCPQRCVAMCSQKQRLGAHKDVWQCVLRAVAVGP